MSSFGTNESSFKVTLQDGAVLKCWSEGDGPTLLLVSGLGGTGGFWKSISATLSHKFRVLRFDQRGMGMSSRGSAPCTIEQLARDCLAVLDAAGAAQCVMLGHSTGGCIGQTLGRLAPERFAGLILSATWLKPSRYMSALFGARRAILDQLPEAYAATSTLMAYPATWLEANWQVFEMALAGAPRSPDARRFVRERIEALSSFDGSADAGALTMPLFVLGARDDLIVPTFLQEELVGALPRAHFVLLNDGGHFFPVSRPDAFTAEVTRWIDAR
jgi:aminoacrylate hydrolase